MRAPPEGRMGGVLGRLPKRFRWTLHNLVAHPLSELAYQAGLPGLAGWVHDTTVPVEVPQG